MGKNENSKRNYRKARERNISVRGVRRNPPDLQKLSQALVALALAQAEAEAQSEHDKQVSADRPNGRDDAPEDGSHGG